MGHVIAELTWQCNSCTCGIDLRVLTPRLSVCTCDALQLYQMQLLTWNTAPGDSLFFHFSGEGGSMSVVSHSNLPVG